MNLDDCLKLHKVSKQDSDQITKLADKYLSAGRKMEEANGSAVEFMLNSLDKEESKIRKQIPADIQTRLKKEVKKAATKEAQRGSIEVPTKAKPFEFENKETEQRYKKAQNVPKETLGKKVKAKVVEIGHKMSRHFEHLPKGGEFARLQFDLLKLAKQKGVASEKTLNNLQGIALDLDDTSYNLFQRKVLLDDLTETAKEGKALPFGFDKKSLKKERDRLNKELTPEVKKSIKDRNEIWEDIKEDYIESQKAIGHDVEDRLTRQNYFRHIVLEYNEAQSVFGTGKKLKTPKGRGFLKKRKGSQLDIVSNYLESEHEVMAQMLYDIEVAKTIKTVDDNYNIVDKLKKKAKKEDKTWQEIIPEGYTVWQPDESSVFYMADSIPAKMASMLHEEILQEIGLTKEDVKKIKALGLRRREFVVKEEVSETLKELFKERSHNLLSEAHREVIRKWKQWQLTSPRRFPKYNFRNLTGDADAVFAGNPAIFKKSPRAFKELYDVYVDGKPMSPELQDWFDRGGFEGTLQAQEMGEINKLKMFLKLQEKKGKIENIPLKLWQGYWKKARMATDFREAILRYAAYIYANEDMNLSKDGLPKSYWASNPAEIKALNNIKDRAYWLSNDLLGAYDRVSVFGQALREHGIPFWSWKEVNMRRYKWLLQNAIQDHRAMELLGRKAIGVGIRSPIIAARVGRFVLQATAFTAFLQVWNHTAFPEEEKELPKSVQEKPHIIFGRMENGDILYFSRLGALSDLLEWFNLDMAPKYTRKWLNGEMTIAEIATEMAKAPVNVLVQGAVPLTKMAGELITRRSLFPDVFEPRVVRDRIQHVTQHLGIRDEYLAFSEKPSKPYRESLYGFFLYKSDPFRAAYGDTFNMKRQYMKKIGKYGEGFWLTESGNALYNFKLSVRYGDKPAAEKYLAEYIDIYAQQHPKKKREDIVKGVAKNIETSMDNLDPLANMTKEEQVKFLSTLNKDEKEKVKMAYKYYVQLRTTPPEWRVK